MESVYLCLDVGGTEIKAAPVNEYGVLLASLRHFPARAKEPADCLMEHFAELSMRFAAASAHRPASVWHFPGRLITSRVSVCCRDWINMTPCTASA